MLSANIRALSQADKLKLIRHTLAFPVGISWIWDDNYTKIPDFVRLWAEWGLFNGISLSTRSQYASGVSIFIKFCENFEIEKPFPVSERLLVLFGSYRVCVDEVQVDTIRHNFAALRKFHLNWGWPDWEWCEFRRLKETMRGWRRSVYAPRRNQRNGWRLVFFQRWEIEIGVGLTIYLDVLMYTSCLVCFWTMGRGGELWANSSYKKDPFRVLTKKQLTFHDGYALITLEYSKTDPFSEGSALLIPEIPDSNLCPVKWLYRLISLRMNARGTPYELDTCNWLFPTPAGRPLTLQTIRRKLVPILHALGEDPNLYNTHSFRIGAATELFQRGVDKETIKWLGRWKGPTVELYNRPPALECARLARRMLSDPVVPGLRNVTFLFGDEFNS